MNERQKYAEVRRQIIEALKIDLIGPETEDEVLEENPAYAYLIGILYPREAETLDRDINITEQKYSKSEAKRS